MPKPPSAYVPLDINYVRDRAVREAGEAAELLYIRALAYCKGAFTDGFVPDYDLDVVGVGLSRVPQRAQKLVDVGLWDVVDGGWQVRSWTRWNETSEETSAKRARAAERQAEKRARDAGASHSDVTRDKPVSHSPKEEEEEEVRKSHASRGDASVTTLRPQQIADGFDEFWSAYPKKQGKDAAKRNYERAVKRGASPDDVLAGAKRYALEVRGSEPKYIKNAEGWLTAGRWQDQPLVPQPATGTTGQEYTAW